jgi:hypothetical protein
MIKSFNYLLFQQNVDMRGSIYKWLIKCFIWIHGGILQFKIKQVEDYIE